LEAPTYFKLKMQHFGVFKTQNRLSQSKWHLNFGNFTLNLTFLPIENLVKLSTAMFFGIVGILENSAFHYSAEKGRSQMISKKYQALKVKKRGFCVFLAFRPIFGDLPIIVGSKNGDFLVKISVLQ